MSINWNVSLWNIGIFNKMDQIQVRDLTLLTKTSHVLAPLFFFTTYSWLSCNFSIRFKSREFQNFQTGHNPFYLKIWWGRKKEERAYFLFKKFLFSAHLLNFFLLNNKHGCLRFVRWFFGFFIVTFHHLRFLWYLGILYSNIKSASRLHVAFGTWRTFPPVSSIYLDWLLENHEARRSFIFASSKDSRNVFSRRHK